VVNSESQANDVSDGTNQATVKSEFRANAGSTLVLRNLPGVTAPRVVLVGLGKHEEYTARVHAQAEQAFARVLVGLHLTEGVSTLLNVPVEGVDLTQRTGNNADLTLRARNAATAAGNEVYYYDRTFGKAEREGPPSLKKIIHIVERDDEAGVEQGLKQGAAIAQGMALARTLGNLPGNICTPAYLGETARQLASEFKSIKVEVLERKNIEDLRMGSFLSVARGSDEPPYFIVLKYSGSKTPKPAKNVQKTGPIVLVGKGITFDSGGISIKPAATMDEMKFDMCGAASVLGAFRALGELNLAIDVVGLIATCENLPSGHANKPGDVVTSMAGHTIEILNTDAEGRLVLCDALTYAERFKPSAVIDIATLTGACVVALGHVNSGLFSTDDRLAEALQSAGKRALDPAWRMPIEEAYQEQLKSNFADMANIGGPPAGSVTAACFLSRFTKAYCWAHLDVAGTAWKGGKDKGATGRPVPLLLQYLLDQPTS
jgi:leucyl aminopeptidase